MIAAAGAGPQPIYHTKLTVEKLAEAIKTCMTPTAVAAAQSISEKMKVESGVRKAVASFHGNLPIKNLTCDLIPNEAASWIYQPRGKAALKLSHPAVCILASNEKIDTKDLKVYVFPQNFYCNPTPEGPKT